MRETPADVHLGLLRHLIADWEASPRPGLFTLIVRVAADAHPDGRETFIRDLARHCGCSFPTIERWINGRNRPHPLFQPEVVAQIKNWLLPQARSSRSQPFPLSFLC